MAKQSKLTRAPQWWKHLRSWKRVFHKQERQNERKETLEELLEGVTPENIHGEDEEDYYATLM